MSLKPDKSTIFGIQKTLLEAQVHFDKLLNFSIGAIAIAGTFTPLMFPKYMDRESKLLTLLLGSLSASGLCVSLELGKRKDKIFQTFDESQLQAFREECQHEIAYDRTTRTIEAQRRLADEISRLPSYEHDRWVAMYSLQGLVAPQALPQQSSSEPIKNTWLTNQPDVESVTYSEPEPGFDWIFEIVQNSCKPLDKRSNQHFKVDGGSQSGKSTFVSLLIALISKLSGQIQLNLVDPKYPMTQWQIQPSFIGYEQVANGIEAAIQELDDRKKQCLAAKKGRQPLPDFKRYLLIVDEWDSIWGNGKGYADVIDRKQAEKIKGNLQRILKESAAYNMSLILVGQSPLSTDNGFSRSSLNSATRIVLGNEALKWVQDPGFPFKSIAQQLSNELENWIGIGKRVALVVPNLGSAPYVEPIPLINLEELFAESMTDTETAQTEETTELTAEQKAFFVLKNWVDERKEKPTPSEVWQAWEKLTGTQANNNMLRYLLEKLGLSSEDIQTE